MVAIWTIKNALGSRTRSVSTLFLVLANFSLHNAVFSAARAATGRQNDATDAGNRHNGEILRMLWPLRLLLTVIHL